MLARMRVRAVPRARRLDAAPGAGLPRCRASTPTGTKQRTAEVTARPGRHIGSRPNPATRELATTDIFVSCDLRRPLPHRRVNQLEQWAIASHNDGVTTRAKAELRTALEEQEKADHATAQAPAERRERQSEQEQQQRQRAWAMLAAIADALQGPPTVRCSTVSTGYGSETACREGRR